MNFKWNLKLIKLLGNASFQKRAKANADQGKKPRSDQEYFEILCLCILQTGLGWKMVRKNWRKFKKAFYNFNINKLARAKVNELMKIPQIIKNRKKIKSLIHNAKEFKKIQEEYGTFSNFLKKLKKFSRKKISKILSNRFKYIGDYNASYYLHSIGY